MPRDPTNNFKFKNYLLGATNIAKNSDKEKYVYNGHGIKFDSPGPWSFDNEFARNAIIFGVDNSSSAYFLVPGGIPTYGINGGFGSPEKTFNINFTKANMKFCLNLHYHVDKIVSFPTQFCL